MLSKWLTYWPHPSFGKHIKVTGILYLYDITNNRLTEPLPRYELFTRLCGNEYPARVVLVLTMCEKVHSTTYQIRREYLTNHWKKMMGEKAAVYSHYGTKKSAWDVVTALGVPDASEVSFFYPREVRSSRRIDVQASSVHPQEPVLVRDWSRPRGPIHTLTVPYLRFC